MKECTKCKKQLADEAMFCHTAEQNKVKSLYQPKQYLQTTSLMIYLVQQDMVSMMSKQNKKRSQRRSLKKSRK